jgi:hypothetical protein
MEGLVIFSRLIFTNVTSHGLPRTSGLGTFTHNTVDLVRVRPLRKFPRRVGVVGHGCLDPGNGTWILHLSEARL